MSELDEIREKIEQIDAQIANCFEQRMELVAKVSDYKKRNGLAVSDKAREEQLLKRMESLIKDEDLRPSFLELERKLIELSCRYQYEKC